jgi:hypothetical protein
LALIPDVEARVVDAIVEDGTIGYEWKRRGSRKPILGHRGDCICLEWIILVRAHTSSSTVNMTDEYVKVSKVHEGSCAVLLLVESSAKPVRYSRGSRVVLRSCVGYGLHKGRIVGAGIGWTIEVSRKTWYGSGSVHISKVLITIESIAGKSSDC